MLTRDCEVFIINQFRDLDTEEVLMYNNLRKEKYIFESIYDSISWEN